MAPSRGAPPTRGGSAQGSGPGRPGKEARDPPAPQIRIGAAHPQAMRGARPRLRVVPPPRRRPAPSPPPAPGRGPWNWTRSVRGGRGQQGTSRGQPPHRPPDRISSAAAEGSQPVGPGGHSIERILQQIQLGVEGLGKIRNEILRIRQDTAKEVPGEKDNGPGLGENGQESRPKREAAQKAMDALKKGADATRGRGRRRGRVYQRAGISRN